MVLFSFVTRKNASTFSCVSQNLIVPLRATSENLVRFLWAACHGDSLIASQFVPFDTS